MYILTDTLYYMYICIYVSFSPASYFRKRIIIAMTIRKSHALHQLRMTNQKPPVLCVVMVTENVPFFYGMILTEVYDMSSNSKEDILRRLRREGVIGYLQEYECTNNPGRGMESVSSCSSLATSDRDRVLS